MEFQVRIELDVEHDYEKLREYSERIRAEANLSQVVLTGIQAMQTIQRSMSPIDKDRRIPASIRPARISRTGNTWSGVSRTTYGPAVFTNEGTGTHGPKGSKYPIHNAFGIEGNTIMHPGIQGTHWWDTSSALGGKIALEGFKRKVKRMMRRT